MLHWSAVGAVTVPDFKVEPSSLARALGVRSI